MSIWDAIKHPNNAIDTDEMTLESANTAYELFGYATVISNGQYCGMELEEA